ncbi:hypothetical protein [Actinoplanes couchii]|uniref:Lipoprotein n=1 Tax=Actinoplanes couchii TaxID=403638 RepID=A0ABQ3XMJ9_9ACTN|nr:hypothetical protein [Actinoplanes couchii]MDR6321631.1 hypothetical protein [Actinoplanes couchii]GID59726.1 hypothetical protein Aco03nite_081300 [Actinoplanes couchii]
MIRTLWTVAGGLSLTLCLVTGCSGEGEDMREMSQEEARQRVNQQADVVRAAAGAAEFSRSYAGVSPCDGRFGESSDIDEIYYIQGIYQMLIPAAEHAAVMAKVKGSLVDSGWTLRSERSFPSGGGEFQAGFGDEFDVLLATGEGRAVSLMVSSPCYRVPGK